MIVYKERPKNRKKIEELKQCGHSLQEIASDYIHFSDGLNKQAKKMLQENENL